MKDYQISVRYHEHRTGKFWIVNVKSLTEANQIVKEAIKEGYIVDNIDFLYVG